jgi:predicted TIM-barrel fold metal-dependent hydrolase
MNKLTFVSSDSHAGVPKELWTEYLDRRYHDLLPGLRDDNVVYPTAIYLLGAKRKATDLPEVADAHRSGYHGLHDPGLRLADMDREGVAAELIYHGDFRLGDMFHNNTNKAYALEAWEAGARAWNRWAADAFGSATDRFLVVSPIGPCTDMDRAIGELDWIADHGFAGTYAPGYMRHPGLLPLYDEYWEPFWSACVDHNLALVVHAGFGWEQGVVFPHLQQIYDQASAAAGGATDLDTMLEHADAVGPEAGEFFREFSGSPRPRRPMWQLMFGGVFDRHPELKLLLTEVRADWLPATLNHLDDIYQKNRSELPARRSPSEYWQDNCLAGASFIHKAEVAMRHEIGVETIAFGRDYPHPEGTWPNTKDWLRDAFAGVPENEVRLMLGENLIRFLGLDPAHLAQIADRIGLSVDDIAGAVPSEVIASFDARGGYLKPAEGAGRLDVVDGMLSDDLLAVTTSTGATPRF